jgi:hypothetical protein
MKTYTVHLTGITSIDIDIQIPEGADVGDYIEEEVWNLPIERQMIRQLTLGESTVDFTVSDYQEKENN